MRAGWLVVAVVLAGCGKPPVREAEPEPVVRRPDPPAPPPKAEPSKKVEAPLLTEADAARLEKEYWENPVAFETRYKGKPFRITISVAKVGIIGGANVAACFISNGGLGDAYVDLATREELEKLATNKTFLVEAYPVQIKKLEYYGVRFEGGIVIGPTDPPPAKRSGRKGP